MGVKCQVQPSMLSLAEEPVPGSNLYLQKIWKAGLSTPNFYTTQQESIWRHAKDQRIMKKTRGEPVDHEEDTQRSTVGWIDDEMNIGFQTLFFLLQSGDFWRAMTLVRRFWIAVRSFLESPSCKRARLVERARSTIPVEVWATAVASALVFGLMLDVVR